MPDCSGRKARVRERSTEVLKGSRHKCKLVTELLDPKSDLGS